MKCAKCGKEIKGLNMYADVDQWYCPACSPDCVNPSYSEAGSKVVFDPKWMREENYDRRKAEEILVKGKVYTISQVDVYGFHTEIYLKEFPGHYFNSVLFQRVPDTFEPGRVLEV
ncbi:MAG: hypothetical protein NC548_13175 [Lachnospiraceae bacterium]|nr:hypothetical protein [Lachnospiraceae bacterium]MCM1230658.1 hypothetical protein [Ruminococcus flavefaciens]MCM1439986.1 hypothetical protein [Roseburia sp.]